MRKIFLGLALFLFVSCSESNQQKVDDAVAKSGDSLKSKLNKLNDTLREGAKDVMEKIPKVKIDIERNIPISLQWISLQDRGNAKVGKEADGWKTIKGEQTNKNNEFLKIDGKIKRIDEFNIKFTGTIITFVKGNNKGAPCEKNGEFVFLKKADRSYYRLQKMENCEGGNVVDYVDLYELDKAL
jgi:hypothetical protein